MVRRITYHPVILAILLLLSFAGSAQRDSSLQVYTLSGNLQPVDQREAFHFIKVIEKEDIDLLNAQNLNDLLKYYLYSSSFYLGAEGYQYDYMQSGRRSVKILLNGQQFWQSSIDKIDLSNLFLIEIERIEIMQGSSGVFYGTNAVLAIINVISKDPRSEGLHFIARGNVSNADEFNTSGMLHLNAGPHRFSIRAGRFFHYGIHGRDSGRVYEWKPNRKAVLSADYSYELLPGLNADASVNYVNSLSKDYGYPAPNTTRVIDADISQEIINAKGGLRGKLSKFHSISFLHNYTSFQQNKVYREKILSQDMERSQADGGTDGNLHYDQYWSGIALERVDKSRIVDYLVGMEFTHQRDRAFDQGAVKTRSTVFSAKGDMRFQWRKDLKLQTGVRLSGSNAFKTPASYEIKGWYYMNSTTVLRSAYGRSYRIPTFNELFFTYEDPSLNIRGNRNLSSEMYDHFNAILSIRSENFLFTSNTIWLQTRNAIQLVEIDEASSTYSFMNTRKTKIMTQGINLEYRSDIFSAEFGIANTGNNQFPDEIGNYYFTQEISSSVKYRIPNHGWTFSSFIKWNSPRNEIRIDSDGELEDYTLASYTLWDLSVLKEIRETGFTIGFGMKNLLNVIRVSGAYLPLDRFGPEDFNQKFPVNVDFGRRLWLNLTWKM